MIKYCLILNYFVLFLYIISYDLCLWFISCTLCALFILLCIFVFCILCTLCILCIFEGSLEVKLPTIWTDEKQSRAEAERRERLEERRSEEKESEERRCRCASRNTVFFQWFVSPEGRKVGSLKRRVRSQLARWEMKICTPLWREAHFEVKMYKTPQCQTTFGSWDVEKVHAVVARSTFWSQNVQSTPASDHFWNLRCRKSGHAVVARSTFWSQNVQNTSVSDDFWKLRCRKSARRCGAKHILKSKCTKHTILGPLLEVEMSKKCTPLWREVHFEVKMYKAHQLRTTFGTWDVEKVHAVVARSTFWSQNVQNTSVSDDFWKLRCRKSARRCGAKHILKSKCTKHTILGPLLEVEMSKKCTPLWREAHLEVKMYKAPHVRATFGGSDVEKVHAVVARSTFPSQNVQNTTCSRHFWRFGCRFASLHYTTPHYTTLPSTTLHYITLHYTPLHYNYNYDYTTTLHYTKLHYTTLHYTTTTTTTTQLHSTTRNYTTLRYITLHYTTFHYTPLHYTTIHWMTLHHR